MGCDGLGGGGVGGGEVGGGSGGPMTLGASTKLKASELTLSVLARASGRAFCVLSADCAVSELAEPSVVTVTEASTLSSVLVVLISDESTPRLVASAEVSTDGAVSESVEEESTSCVTVKLAVVCMRRPCLSDDEWGEDATSKGALSARRDDSAVTSQLASLPQMVLLSPSFI